MSYCRHSYTEISTGIFSSTWEARELGESLIYVCVFCSLISIKRLDRATVVSRPQKLKPSAAIFAGPNFSSWKLIYSSWKPLHAYVHLLGKTAQVGPANMAAAANLFGFTFETTDAQSNLFEISNFARLLPAACFAAVVELTLRQYCHA